VSSTAGGGRMGIKGVFAGLKAGPSIYFEASAFHHPRADATLRIGTNRGTFLMLAGDGKLFGERRPAVLSGRSDASARA
jgi:hypothetical protein